ncbi:MAG: nucleotide exchange factor GrpE [Eubacterium sp.]|nr:nucleotide exchange factor GrpE [Eubacterium sp.]
MLQALQNENEEGAVEKPATNADGVINVVIGEPIEGTIVTVDDEQYVTPSEADARRPKPVPKKNRRGNKELLAELERTKELAEGNKDKYTRLMAEFDNARARSEKENSKMFDYGAKDTLEKLLPIVDDFERALDNIPESEKGAFSNGIEMIYKKMMDTLKGIGVEPMNAVDKQFDPNFHNAVIHVEDENLPENTVIEEMQKGYMYKDQVLRHSMVKVAN